MSKIIILTFLCLTSLMFAMKINTEEGNYKDEFNRTVIYHGVNVVVKLPPYLPTTESFDPFMSLSSEDMVIMKKFGFNLVRLGVIWESVETAPGVFSYEHLQKVEDIINMLGSNGISVILDAHQDLFSRIFCGEGVPVFYAKNLTYNTDCGTNIISKFFKLVHACLPLSNFNWQYDDNGLPLIEGCKKSFMKAHQSPELTTIYESFYNNENGVQDKFIDFWKVLASTFKDNKYIIGYDLWNEPWSGKLWTDLRYLWPGHADKLEALPFYQKLDAELREIKSDFVGMYQPIPFPDTVPLFAGYTFPSFAEMPAGKDKLQYQVLNVHSYCCQAGPNICSTGEPLIEDATFCRSFHERKMLAHVNEAKALQVPLIITEFGACSSSEACYQEMKTFTEVAENHFVSWAYWMYKSYGDHTTSAYEHSEGMFQEDGTPQDVKVKALTRSYIQVYQGKPVSSQFDAETGLYSGSYYLDETVLAPSILYLNTERFYPEGFSVRLFNDKNKNYDAYAKIVDNNYVHFFISNSTNKLITAQDEEIVYVAVGKTFNYTENYSSQNTHLKVSYELSSTKTNSLHIKSQKSNKFTVEETSHLHGKSIKATNEIGDLIINLSSDLLSSVDIKFAQDGKDYKITLFNLLYYSVKVSLIEELEMFE